MVGGHILEPITRHVNNMNLHVEGYKKGAIECDPAVEGHKKGAIECGISPIQNFSIFFTRKKIHKLISSENGTPKTQWNFFLL